MDEQELLKIQIKSYEFYAGLIERAVGGGTSAKLPRWDEQRALEYRALADQLRQRLATLQAQSPVGASDSTSSEQTTRASESGSVSAPVRS